jgi:tellurite resistance protein
MLIHPAAVLAEWNHPIRATFFPAASISLLLMAVCFLPENAGIANILWIIGAILQGFLTLAIIGRWIGHKPFEYSHINPAWFIPAVGNVVVPIAGAQLGYIELSWLFFSGGLMFWIILLTLVMNRLIFHTPLPGKLLPTLVIMIAPPAVAFLAYLQLSGGVDTFARILLNLGYVFALIVLTQIPRILKLPFAMSFWALSFPIASLAIASFRYGALAKSQAHEAIGIILLAVLVAVIAVLTFRTLLAIMRGQVCQPE